MACIEFSDTVSATYQQSLKGQLLAFNKSCVGRAAERHPIGIYAHDDNGELVGGITGTHFSHWLNIEFFWVAKPHRGQGVGRMLLSQIDDKARSLDITKIFLDTYSFQAPELYRKLGFQQLAVLDDCPIKGCSKFFFLKGL